MSLSIKRESLVAYMDGKNTNPTYLQDKEGMSVRKGIKNPLPATRYAMVAFSSDPFGVSSANPSVKAEVQEAYSLENLSEKCAVIKAKVAITSDFEISKEDKKYLLALVKSLEVYNAAAKA